MFTTIGALDGLSTFFSSCRAISIQSAVLNVLCFTDSDFDVVQYSAAGSYLKLRLKFDQQTRVHGMPAMSHSTALSSEPNVRVVDLNETPAAAGQR